MGSIKIKFKQQLKKEGIVAYEGYGNGYTLKKEGKMIGYVPFSLLDRVYYDWESSNKGYGKKDLLESIKEEGLLEK